MRLWTPHAAQSDNVTLLPRTRVWRIALLGAVALFIVTRALTLMAFPIFNDEAIYLQYSQAIHDSWQKNRFISMNGGYHDWKPPLQYWLAAPFIRGGSDPLLQGRLVAVLFSLVGLAGTYLFTKELLGGREGVIAVFLYALCPAVLLYNIQFIAEAFLFSTAALFYWCVLRLLRAANRPAAGFAIAAVLLGTALLLFKQSGLLLLLLALGLPFARRLFVRNFIAVAGIVGCAYLGALLVIPAEFEETRRKFDSKWVLSAAELMQLPIAVWWENLGVTADFIGAYYSWALLPALALFAWSALRTRGRAELVLGGMCIVGACAVIFALRGFNEYMVNTAVVAVLLPMLARALVAAWSGPRILRYLACGLGLFFAVHWGYQMALVRISPAGYVARSTPWAVDNYLHGWSSGFGVREVVEMLAREPERTLVIADAQWGNPRTALEVYTSQRLPHVHVTGVGREFLDPAEARRLRDEALHAAPVRYVIFSADPSGIRAQWQANIEREMCDRRTEVRAAAGQSPIVICGF